MGSGKTTLGNKLAKKFDYSFVDLDQYIEKWQNKSVNEIFNTSGEKYFREIEKKALQELVKTSENEIIATGGGTPCYSDNMEIMNNCGVTVYLKYNSKFLLNRINSSKTQRPLIENIPVPERIEFIEKLLSEREPSYTKSKIIIEKVNITADFLFEEISKYIENSK